MKLDSIKELPEILTPTIELENLPSSGCKWPYENLMCCGRPQAEGKVYCQDHYDFIKRPQQSYKADPVAQAQMTFHGAILGKKKKPKVQMNMQLMQEDIG